MLAIFIFFGLVIVAGAFMAIQIFNNLVALRNQVDRAWANVDVILKQRFDEIPQLIEVVEQYVEYEKETIATLVEARTRYVSAGSLGEKIDASNAVGKAFSGVVAIGEGYPDLKASAQFVQLQSRVSALEGLLSDRRELVNDTVTNLNTRIQQVPDLFFASMLRYERLPLFLVEAAEKGRSSLKIQRELER